MHDWKKVVLKTTDTMQTAIEVLNTEALRIVMVVDDQERLVGTVTDGDIRRGLIKHMTMEALASEFMFENPTYASEGENKEAILAVMKAKGLMQIPIIDEEHHIVGLETLRHFFELQRYDNPVILMAGGFGTRLRPLTDHTPKPLLNVGNKAILEIILEQFIAGGFHNFYISTHYKAEMVRDHFGDGSKWGVSINYIHEKEPLGTAGALGLLPSDLIDLPVIMMNGDLLTKVDYSDLLKFHMEQGGESTMCVREYDFQVPYGVIEADGNRVTKIVEKPVQSFFVNAGVYVISSSLVKSLDGLTYMDMPRLLEQTIERKGQVNMFPLHEYWLDIGQMEQFEKAQVDSRVLFE